MKNHQQMSLNFASKKISLRDYQQQAIALVQESFKIHDRLCLQLPTGAGKTVLFVSLSELFFINSDYQETILILVHREELLLQARQKIIESTGLQVGTIKANQKFIPDQDIYVASVQTLVRRDFDKCFPTHPGLIIIDECHHVASNTYLKILNKSKKSKVLGVTATPSRLDGIGLEGFFTHLISGNDFEASSYHLINRGFLSNYQVYGLPFFSQEEMIKAIASSRKKARTTETDGTKEMRAYARLFDHPKVNRKIVEEWKKHANQTQTIIFAINVQHSKNIVKEFEFVGIKAAHLDGTTPKKLRGEILDKFRQGEIQVLSNCLLFTEGFDVPNIETVQIIRPTASQGLWFQMIGRALRVAPGKDHAKIIDHTHNHQKLGLPDDLIKWSLEHEDNSSQLLFSCKFCNHSYLESKRHLKTLDTTKLITEETIKSEEDGLVTETKKEKYDSVFDCQSCSYPINLSFTLLSNTLPDTVEEKEDKASESDTELADLDPETQELVLVWDSKQLKVNSEVKKAIDELIYSREMRGYKPAWVWYKFLDKLKEDSSLLAEVNENEMKYLCCRLGYKKGWLHYRMGDINSLKNADHQNDLPEHLKGKVEGDRSPINNRPSIPKNKDDLSF